MSNIGQALTAIAGGIIGFFVGGGPTGALYGFEIGLLAGTVISPTRLPGTSGPRLTDGNTTTASIGDPVNFGYGLFAVSGTVVYLGACIEHSTTSSSSAKGAPSQSQTTYTYTQTIAIGLCEGPINSVRRIWENGQLLYDTRPQLAGETDADFTARQSANATYASTMVIHLGREDQVADPTIETEQGSANTPAFRGLAYIMYPNRSLRDDQGQRHPQFKFEVYVQTQAGYDANDPTSLEDMVTLICARCGYDTASQIDATSLSDTTVNGYSIQRSMTGRDALAPLRSVGLFDVAESGPKLRFQKRGGAPLRTLTLQDIGVYDDPGGTTAPDAAITRTGQQDVELPQQIRVNYIASSSDYEDGQQLSQARFDTDAVNLVDVELAVCIDDDQAAQLADILWADSWASRFTYNTSVDQSQADIEPSDVLIIPFQGVDERMRVSKINDASQIVRGLTLISDDDGSYVSDAVADPPARPPAVTSVQSGSVLVLLDLPPLTDDVNDAGLYAIAHGDGTGNRWNSAVVYTSVDGGDTFTQKATLTGTPPFGYLLQDLPAGQTDTWDDHNYLDVQALKGTFESRTEDALLAGANALAVGADGRWEIVQFANVDVIAETAGNVFYRLSHLLRGRRGTEWAVGTGVTNDAVIALTTGNLFRIGLMNSQIGQAIVYKSVTGGAPFLSGTDETFTGHGVALKPFAPCHVSGAFSGSDFVISWLRRDRLSETLRSGMNTPMSEATEAYEVDIYNGASIVRTISGLTTPTATYTSSQITADFGSPPTSFHVKVYQLSAIVGRGYAGDATVP